ncbi:MAG: acyltransferase [Actinobacteria bacterium]|jgi:peptidoglycan/LPS O-acetylase OafA/YrhL|nr:acyltransferase [Actinomycetota bacterium]HRV67540.1 acyltransferase [Candidatus Nanopelagicales bacterium]
MGDFIRQLTGVRFIAAAWVMLYHYQPALAASGLLVPVLHEFLRLGSVGVDLFFALSGFILTHTYLTRLGPRLTGAGSLNFWWLRLARVYPVYFLMLNVAGLAALAEGVVTGEGRRDWMTFPSYLQQVFMVQEWGPDPQRGWNFPAWSLSMEWLAYLFFPLLVLLLWRLRDRFGPWALAGLAFLALTPLLYIGLTRDDDPFLVQGWASTIRIATEFTAGSITYLAVRKWQDSLTAAKAARALAWIVPAAILVIAVVMGNIDALQWEGLPDEAPRGYVVIIPLLILWLGALALSNGRPSKFLSTHTLVVGGFISYSLYLVHIVWYGLWRAGMKVVGIESGPLYLLSTLLLIAATVGLAYLMWHRVEEPAREWMRAKIGVRKVPTEEAGEQAR